MARAFWADECGLGVGRLRFDLQADPTGLVGQPQDSFPKVEGLESKGQPCGIPFEIPQGKCLRMQGDQNQFES